MRYLSIILGLLLIPLMAFVWSPAQDEMDQGVPLMTFRASLGDSIPSHYRPDADEALIEAGRQLVHEGKADYLDFNGDYISRFYVCTSCHNTVREDPDLALVDPAARLQYAADKGIPYLQGSTFWGIVNRTEWYNDDYVKKYGSLVEPAHESLAESIQLCAQECSQGRILEDWELSAILAYLTTLEVMVNDLDLSAEERLWLESEGESADKLALLDERFLARSPATFGETPSDKLIGYYTGFQDDEVDPKFGSIIYNQSCRHCHKGDGVSDLVLDESKKTMKWLLKNIDNKDQLSLYEIVRHGTVAEYGHREYMPLYTQEKMTDAQVESLRAYIEDMAR